MATFLLSQNRTEVLERMDSINIALDHWASVQNLGKKPRTRQFNEQIVATIKKNFPALDKQPAQVTEEDILLFAQRVNDYCPSRWNAMVSALRSLTDRARIMKRRKLRFRDFTPPNHQEFSKLLVECDAAPRSNVGLVVRFLTLTGVRFCEIRKLQWRHIGLNSVNISAEVSKNGRARSIPFLPGVSELMTKLRNDSELVVPRPHIRRALRTACARAGVSLLSYHCLRHVFATRCIEAGCDLPTVARWMGHQDGGALLARMYFHLIDSHSRLMAAKVRIV